MKTTSRSDEIDTPRLQVRGSAWRRWLMPLALLGAAFALQALASRNPQSVERYYSRKLFPAIINLLSLLNGVVGFSMGELMIYVLVAALVGTLIYQAREIYLRRKRMASLVGTDLLVLLSLLGSAMLLFLLVWGLNYQREPLADKLAFAGRSASDEQLRMISETIVNEVNSNYGQSHASDAVDGSRQAPLSRSEVYALVESAYLQEPLLKGTGGRYGPPKPLYFSGLMSRLGLSGFYMPFTGEPNFNAAQPDFDLPYVIAHEKAHQRGFAREDEANFLAFLVCVNSPNPYVRYSGYLNALKVVGALGGSDSEFYKTLVERIGEGPRSDLRARADFWARHEGPARAVADKVNNSYLKANRIESGTQSYSEDIALIIGYYLMRARNDRN
jgi:hypothetical protein